MKIEIEVSPEVIEILDTMFKTTDLYGDGFLDEYDDDKHEKIIEQYEKFSEDLIKQLKGK